MHTSNELCNVHFILQHAKNINTKSSKDNNNNNNNNKLAPCGTDGRLLCLQSVFPVSVEKLPKAETSISMVFSQ